MLTEHTFASRHAAAGAVATRIESSLHRRLAAKGRVNIVVSGGSTPVETYVELSHKNLDWNRVTVFLSDERWVPNWHKDSNEKLVRDELLKSRARDAAVYPYFQPGTTIEVRCQEIDAELNAQRTPFASTLLGMGEDGHFASLFPDAPNLQLGLEANTAQLCLPIRTVASEHQRISMTLTGLLLSDEIHLLIFGENKKNVFESAKIRNSSFPVSRLLSQTKAPLHVYWAP